MEAEGALKLHLLTTEDVLCQIKSDLRLIRSRCRRAMSQHVHIAWVTLLEKPVG